MGAAVLIGFTSTVAQVVLMRELMVVFNGNEMSLGVMLAIWMLWTAAGSAMAGRLPLAGLLAALATALPLTILAVSGSKNLFQAVPGEVLGPLPMLVVCLAGLGPVCVFSGALFASASRRLAAELGHSTARVYLLEACGSALGGLTAAVAVIWLSASAMALSLAALCATASAWIARRRSLAALALLSVAAVPFVSRQLEAASLALLWRGFHVLGSENSRYGNLVVTETEGSRTLFENGLPVATAPDPEEAEESVHYAILEHPEPRSVLVIGGGLNGSLAEVLKHPTVQSVDYVEVDPAILRIAGRQFPAPPADARLHLRATDGRAFVKSHRNGFDVIIVNVPDPETAQLNRFYTLEFFGEASAALTAQGVLAIRLTAAENYIRPELAEFLRSIHATLRGAFEYIALIPGGTLRLFASHAPLVQDAATLLGRLRARRVTTSFVREYFLPFRMARGAQVSERIKPFAGTPVNRDFAPIAYYYQVALWSQPFRGGSVFRALSHIPFAAITALMACLALAAVTLFPKTSGACSALSAATTGFTLIGFQVLLLLGFQALYGYVYHQLALLTAGFMAGMGGGTWLGLRAQESLGRLAALQAAIGVAPLAIYAAMPHLPAPLFATAAILSGALGGFEFALASRLFFRARAGCNPGTLYALDLAGAAAGALLLSVYLIPMFGFLRTAGLLAIANAAPALLAVLARRTPGS